MKLSLEKRKPRFEGKHCINCDILITARLSAGKRSYKYCRMCIEEHPDEVFNHRNREHYKKNKKAEKARRRKYYIEHRAEINARARAKYKQKHNATNLPTAVRETSAHEGPPESRHASHLLLAGVPDARGKEKAVVR